VHGLQPLRARARCARVCITAVITLQFAAAAAIAAPAIIELGVLPGYETSSAVDVSADGAAVAGYSYTVATTPDDGRAVRWTSATGLQNLGTLPPLSGSLAVGISDDGLTVVGHTGVGRAVRPFHWTSNDGMILLPTLPGFTSGAALGISDDGSVIVGYNNEFSPANGARIPYASFWSGGNATALAPGAVSSCNAVNDDGTVMVGYVSGSAVLWNPAGEVQHLGVLPGDTSASANAVSADGTIVGGYSYHSADGTRAFRWTSTTGMQYLGRLPGGTRASISDMTADGSVLVGGADNGVGPRAILWSAPTNMVDLNIYFTSLGVNLSGWTLTEASGISADGTTIVGVGTHDGQTRGWIVTGLPDPAGISVFSAGAVICLRRRAARNHR
jgi:probable HAF family extracellular repeat protein